MNIATGLALSASALIAAQGYAAVVVTSFEGGLDIPLNPTGLYLNVETGATGTSAVSPPAGWNIQMYGTAGLNFLSTGGFGFARIDASTASDGPTALPIGFTVAPSMASATWIAGGSATGLEPGSDQVFIGFRFVASSGTSHYGWMRFAIAEGGASTGRRLLEYAYESTPDAPIAVVPAPGLALAFGAIALSSTRRRR